MHHFCVFRELQHADEWTTSQLQKQMVFLLLNASTSIITDGLCTIFYWITEAPCMYSRMHIDVLLSSDAYTAELLITELETA